jgi:hypothetical protein
MSTEVTNLTELDHYLNRSIGRTIVKLIADRPDEFDQQAAS